MRTGLPMLKSDGNTEEGSLDLRLVGRLATCPSFPDSGTVPVSPYPPPPVVPVTQVQPGVLEYRPQIALTYIPPENLCLSSFRMIQAGTDCPGCVVHVHPNRLGMERHQFRLSVVGDFLVTELLCELKRQFQVWRSFLLIIQDHID